MCSPKIPVRFEFQCNGGSMVLLAGSFSNWKPLTMTKSSIKENLFWIDVSLSPGIYSYKFIDNGKWVLAPGSPTIKDLDGNENNLIHVKSYQSISSGVSTDIPLLEKESSNNKKISTFTDAHRPFEQNILIITVGLPVYEKSFLSHKILRYLDWLGFPSKLFSKNSYFNPDMTTYSNIPYDIHQTTIDILDWFNTNGTIAVLDGIHYSKAEREFIVKKMEEKSDIIITSIFIEFKVNENDITESLLNQYESLNINNDNVQDFMKKIREVSKTYEPLDKSKSFICLYDNGTQIASNNVTGFVPAKLMFYTSNLKRRSSKIYLVRHGQSEYNIDERIGGNSSLTEKGLKFANELQQWVEDNIPDASNNLCVWSSTLTRSIECSQNIPCYSFSKWDILDEINAGICDGMTYDEIKNTYPDEYEARQKDKFCYRYPQGESYEDIFIRVEPVIIELERRNIPVIIVGHQAVLRCIYSYFSNRKYSREEIPHIPFPSHTIVQITPDPFEGTKEERISFKI